MTDTVDVVIPWLNPTEKWFSEYKNYCENEHPGRIRDMNTMRPTINGILKNLTWIRYIWLIVYDEEQIPKDWDELKNEKIKFVFHNDIIPAEFLPNFNSMLTEAYFHKIPDLAEFVLFMNDDMIFTKPVPKTYYVRNGKTVHRKKSLMVRKNCFRNTYQKIINSTCDLIQTITKQRVMSDDFHMPCILKKSLLEFVWKKYNKALYNSFTNSKIRKEKNISIVTLLLTLEEVYNMCTYSNDTTIKTKPIWLNDTTTSDIIIEALNNNHIVCLNDGEVLSDEYAITLKNMLKRILS